MFFYTYVLLSLKDNKFYIGFTENLRKRLAEHNDGKSFATKCRRPFELIFYEAYRNKYDALRREKYFKTSKGKTTLKSMLREYLENKGKCSTME
jgi:putative endonuclease